MKRRVVANPNKKRNITGFSDMTVNYSAENYFKYIKIIVKYFFIFLLFSF